MNELVEELLLLARLDEGRPLEQVTVDLAALLVDAARTARTVAPDHPVALSVTEVVTVTGDATRLRQVVDNLLANVRTHTPPGTITSIALTTNGPEAVVVVADDGPGMQPVDAERMFERFYRTDSSRSRQTGGAGLGMPIVAAIVAAGRLGVRSTAVYLVLGVFLWAAVFKSGIHATVAGVILAALTPSRAFYTPQAFEAGASELVASYRQANKQGQPDTGQQALGQLEELTRGTESPLDRLEHRLHPWVSYGIVPIFALANAGVVLSGGVVSDAAGSAIAMGTILGLVVGKPVGILLACLIMLKLKFATLPANAGISHLIGVGMLAGIGFTVSLFIAGLAFDDPALTNEAKIGILAASVCAGILGFVYLFILPGEPATDEDLEEERVEVPTNA